jgi:predicted nuclease of predicted toxin-antitoxin system
VKPLRLLLDQMLDTEIASRLASQGHDVVRLSDVGMSRADDDAVLAQAIEQGRVLVTLDEHFGDWVVLPLSEHPGVVRLKTNPATTASVLGLLLPFLETHSEREFTNRLVIVRNNGVRWVRTGDE